MKSQIVVSTSWVNRKAKNKLKELAIFKEKNYEFEIERRMNKISFLGWVFPFLPKKIKYPTRNREDVIKEIKTETGFNWSDYKSIFGKGSNEKRLEILADLNGGDTIYLDIEDWKLLHSKPNTRCW